MKTSTAIVRWGAGVGFALVAFALPAAASAAQVNIGIYDDYFSPQSITINAGDTIVWSNQGTMAHTVTSDTNLFNSGSISVGGAFSATFNTPGTYPYHCQFHGAPGTGMHGTITVVASGANNNSQTTITQGATGPIPGTANGTLNNSNTVYSSQTSSQTQAQALLAEVQQLEQEINAISPGAAYSTTSYTNSTVGGAAPGTCPLIGRSLGLGSSGDDVTRLQQYLAENPSIYPQGVVSGYYGALTQSAVEAWQTKYNIVSSGTPETTGYGVVGPRTAAAIALQCSQSSSSGSSSTGASGALATVSGFLQVSPITGNAPLVVTVTATINTANSCSGAVYSLSFGDGTASQQLVSQAGSCSQAAQTMTHTYQYGGSYQITLSSGTHQTTATVTVTGNAAPSTQQTSGIPTETFSATPQSGGAPLSVTFSGVVNSNDAGFSTGSDTLDFGDGSQASVTLPSSVGSWVDYSIVHTYSTPGGFNAKLFQGAEASGALLVGNATITVASGSAAGYTPPTVTPDVGGNPLAVSAVFNLESSCDPYQVNWGDGSSPSSYSPPTSTTNCSLAAQSATVNHTYATSSPYTITFLRGSGLSRHDTVAITITK